ncbi:Uncharacterised protein [Vibrio cholerae]|nr:Uncharacterised protein [Vibrio cholerae]
MCPVVFLSKFRQKTSCSNGATWAATNVCHIGKWALELLMVFISQWQTPCAIARLLRGIHQLMCQRVVVRHHRADVMA